MTQFLRVRDKQTKHEFDIPVARAERDPDRYKVLDPEPVDRQRPPKHHTGAPTKEAPEPDADARLSQSGDPVVNDPRLSQPE